VVWKGKPVYFSLSASFPQHSQTIATATVQPFFISHLESDQYDVGVVDGVHGGLFPESGLYAGLGTVLLVPVSIFGASFWAMLYNFILVRVAIWFRKNIWPEKTSISILLPLFHLSSARFPPIHIKRSLKKSNKHKKTTFSKTAEGGLGDNLPGNDLLSQGSSPSTIGAGGLNFRVRDGNGWIPSAMVTRQFDWRALEDSNSRPSDP
jgi:hypothetical protein